MEKQVKRPEVNLAYQQKSRREQVDKFAGYPGGWAGKPMQVGERITGDGLFLLSGGFPGWRLDLTFF